MRQDASLSGARPRHDQERAARVRDGLQLGRVEAFEEAFVAGPGAGVGSQGRQWPIPTCCDRWSDFPSVSNAGATITSAFWNSFTLP